MPVPSALPAWPAVPASVVTTCGARVGSVEYWKRVSVLLPSGLTLPLSVAAVLVMAVAACVVATGGVSSVRRFYLGVNYVGMLAANESSPPYTAVMR